MKIAAARFNFTGISEVNSSFLHSGLQLHFKQQMLSTTRRMVPPEGMTGKVAGNIT